MHVGRHTTAQSAEIHSFGVHLSTWLTVGKERTRMSRRNAPENFFSAVRGCPPPCARTNPWFRGRIWGEKCAQEPTLGSAVKHCRFLDTGGGGGYKKCPREGPDGVVEHCGGHTIGLRDTPPPPLAKSPPLQSPPPPPPGHRHFHVFLDNRRSAWSRFQSTPLS